MSDSKEFRDQVDAITVLKKKHFEKVRGLTGLYFANPKGSLSDKDTATLFLAIETCATLMMIDDHEQAVAKLKEATHKANPQAMDKLEPLAFDSALMSSLYEDFMGRVPAGGNGNPILLNNMKALLHHMLTSYHERIQMKIDARVQAARNLGHAEGYDEGRESTRID